MTDTLYSLAGLRTLSLSSNPIRTLDPRIRNLKALKTLSIYEIGLTQLPSEIGNLTNLEELNLSKNGLSTVPREIAQFLIRLRKLDLTSNLLESLPPEMAAFSPNCEFSVDAYGLKGIPAELKNRGYGSNWPAIQFYLRNFRRERHANNKYAFISYVRENQKAVDRLAISFKERGQCVAQTARRSGPGSSGRRRSGVGLKRGTIFSRSSRNNTSREKELYE